VSGTPFAKGSAGRLGKDRSVKNVSLCKAQSLLASRVSFERFLSSGALCSRGEKMSFIIGHLI
jgi:hypothetical protein